ncbi:MAG: hypothetical protein V1773_10650 [bacterium]
MKKTILLISVFLSIVGISCEENISPVEGYKERYAFYCILGGDANKHTALLVKSYQQGNNNIDPFIKGAEIGMFSENFAIYYRDTIVPRIDTSQYKTPQQYYYIKNYEIPLNKKLDIEVLLPNGKRLFASTTTPDTAEFPKNLNVFLPDAESSLLTYTWTPSDPNAYVIPRLAFAYYKKVNEVFTYQGEKEVPITYYEHQNVYTPIYPKAQRQNSITFEKGALTRALLDISRGDVNSNNYAVGIYVKFQLKILDKNLSSYYSSTNEKIGEYNINLDQTDYTNITGGYGVFGSYIIQEKTLFFVEDFIDLFGYSIIFNN